MTLHFEHLVRWKGKLFGFEMKYGDAPIMTKSLHIAMQDLALDHAFIVYPGARTYPLSDKVTIPRQLNLLEATAQKSCFLFGPR